MIIEDKFAQLVGNHIYNTTLDKFGIISSMKVASYVGGYAIEYEAFYDDFNKNMILSIDDFKNGIVKLCIITGLASVEVQYNNALLENFKSVMGKDYTGDMVLVIEEAERQKRNRDNEEKNVLKMYGVLVPVDRVSVEAIAKDFYSRELYVKYMEGVIGHEELIYALINYLAQELEREKERHANSFLFEVRSRSILKEAAKKSNVFFEAGDGNGST